MLWYENAKLIVLVHDLALVLARQLEAASMSADLFVVAIDGPGCCGKSTLGESLAKATKVALLETDDFHLPRGAARDTAGPLPYRRWREFVAAAEGLARGLPVRVRPIDWSSRALLPERAIQPARIVLIEGIGSLHEDLAHLVDFRIWVDGRAQTRLARVALRNGEAVAGNWGEYIPLEQAYLEKCRPWRSADLWICGAELTLGDTEHSFSRLIEEHGVAIA